jgi:hypothetical protein
VEDKMAYDPFNMTVGKPCVEDVWVKNPGNVAHPVLPESPSGNSGEKNGAKPNSLFKVAVIAAVVYASYKIFGG